LLNAFANTGSFIEKFSHQAWACGLFENQLFTSGYCLYFISATILDVLLKSTACSGRAGF